jgi:hypothetical protein
MARFPSYNPPGEAGGARFGGGGLGTPDAIAPPPPGGGTINFTTGGPTLQALRERQQRLQQAAPELPPPTQMTSPWQGASYLANTLVNSLQQNAAAAQEEQGQKEFANAMSTGIDLNTGEVKPEAMSVLMARDPEVGMQFIGEMIKSRREAANAEHWTPIPTPEGENGQWFQNQKGDTKKVGGGSTGESGWKPSDLGTLRDDYTKAATVYDQASPSWQSMKEAANTALSPESTVEGKGAADYNMIVGFAKLLDPNSVVREGEVQSASMTGGQLEQLNGWLNQWRSAGSLSDSVRRGIMTQANSRMGAYYDQVKQKRDWISGIATRNKINPDDVVPPLPAFQPYGEGGGGGQDLTNAPDDVVPKKGDYVVKTGTTYVYSGEGDPSDTKNWTVKQQQGGQ